MTQINIFQFQGNSQPGFRMSFELFLHKLGSSSRLVAPEAGRESDLGSGTTGSHRVSWPPGWGLQLSLCSGATELSSATLRDSPRGHTLGHPWPGTRAWFGAPWHTCVERLWPQLPGRPRPPQAGELGHGRCAQAAPWFFQFLMPAPQVAAWGDSGTATFCMMQVQPPAEPLPPGLATS